MIFIMLLAGFVALIQMTFCALLEDFYPDRFAVKDRDKTPRITSVILITDGRIPVTVRRRRSSHRPLCPR
jgi:hypothetical protein